MPSTIEEFFRDPSIVRLTTVAIIAAVILIGSRLLQRILSHRMESGSAYRFRKAVGITAYVAVTLVLVGAYSDRLGGFTVALGVAGAGIAFALQEVIASFAGWVALAFGRFYSTGDRVQLGGIKGDVIDIGILRTTLMEVGQWVDGDLYNGRIVRVANSFVFKEPVFNYSADFPFLWDEIKIPIRYGSDWHFASAMLVKVLDEVCGEFARHSAASWSHARERYALEDAAIQPLVTMIANDNWIEFTARYVVDYRQRRLTKDKLFRRILTEVDASGNRLRLASATFEVVNFPRVDISSGAAKIEVVPSYTP